MERENKNNIIEESSAIKIGPDFFEHLWGKSWVYIKTFVDVVREPVLVLDKYFRVMAANESFYKTFQVQAKDTEKKAIYDLGNGQWNIPSLRKLLEDILPKKTFFKGFEVAHEFPGIGRKVIILNARQIFFHDDGGQKSFPSIILLAMEDITEMIAVAEKLAYHTNYFESKMSERTQLMEEQILSLQKEISKLKKPKP